MRGDLEAGFQAFVDNYKKCALVLPVILVLPDYRYTTTADVCIELHCNAPFADEDANACTSPAAPREHARDNCACRFAGYVPGGHGNQRGPNQPAQHSPAEKPGMVPGFYQLGFA